MKHIIYVWSRSARSIKWVGCSNLIYGNRGNPCLLINLTMDTTPKQGEDKRQQLGLTGWGNTYYVGQWRGCEMKTTDNSREERIQYGEVTVRTSDSNSCHQGCGTWTMRVTIVTLCVDINSWYSLNNILCSILFTPSWWYFNMIQQ